jgi:hypothetical protein
VLSRVSVVGIATGYGLDDGGVGVRVPVRSRIFFFSKSSRPALGSTQPPIQCVPRAVSSGVKRPGREADHSPPTSAEVKESGSIHPLLHTPSWRSEKKRSYSCYQAAEAPIFFLDNRLTDCGEVVSLMRRPPFTPRKIPGTHFCRYIQSLAVCCISVSEYNKCRLCISFRKQNILKLQRKHVISQGRFYTEPSLHISDVAELLHSYCSI